MYYYFILYTKLVHTSLKHKKIYVKGTGSTVVSVYESELA